MRNRLHVPIRVAALIDAPESSIRRALDSTSVWTRSAVALGGSIEFASAGPRVVAGDLMRLRSGPRRLPRLFRVGRSDGLPSLSRANVAGRSTVELKFHALSGGAGCLLTADFTVDLRIAILNGGYRSTLIPYGEMLLGITTLVAREPVRVVAGALISDGKVLVARRREPGGRWELPGGKVEPGESDEEALERELIEELAIRSKVSRRIGPLVTVSPGVEMVCYRATPTHDDEIRLADHDAYRWVAVDELETIDFLESDRELVDSLRITLQIPS